MSQHVVRRLRPHLFTALRHSRSRRALSQAPSLPPPKVEREVTHDYQKRVVELQTQRALSDYYPRLPPAYHERAVSIRKVLDECRTLEPGQTDASLQPSIAGRIHSVRTAGSKLFFIDLQESRGSESDVIQVVADLSKLPETSREALKQFVKLARKGDHCIVTGHSHRTARGEPSILASALPKIVAPSLHQIPSRLDDAETKARLPHANMLVNPQAIRTMRIAYLIDEEIRKYFFDQGFTGVRTPLLSAGAGGATARPFETVANELQGEKLNLRIAPELFLKRLVVGGMNQVFEIGPAFRNEGVDATHNPEFTICEFYEAFATLDRLIDRTQHILRLISDRIQRDVPDLEGIGNTLDMNAQPARLEFIPAIEEALGHPLPDLSLLEEAQVGLVKIFKTKGIQLPSKPTLPRLLDALSGYYLESHCDAPTFITHHPAALSPLAKHFVCPKSGQIVAARAELFIKRREYANMYEEENSPFEQRQKFEEQLKYRQVDGEGDGRSEVDESYLEALEWGLPPTGGWGCGVDRLVMLFAGQERMADVLPFGSLRNVVGLTHRW